MVVFTIKLMCISLQEDSPYYRRESKFNARSSLANNLKHSNYFQRKALNEKAKAFNVLRTHY